MGFQIIGLDGHSFSHLYGLADEELARRGVSRHRVDSEMGYPDRVEMRDCAPGERVLLLNHVHQPADNAYRASHAIFVREGAMQAYHGIDTVPQVMRIRPISLRAFDATHAMVDADLVDGTGLEAVIARLFGDARVSYLQAHYAKRGCFAARIERA